MLNAGKYESVFKVGLRNIDSFDLNENVIKFLNYFMNVFYCIKPRSFTEV